MMLEAVYASLCISSCFLKGPGATEIYTYCHPLSLHDALPILGGWLLPSGAPVGREPAGRSPKRRRCCSRHMHTAGFWSYPQAGSGPEPLKDSVKNESLSKLSRSKSDFFDIFSRACKTARWVKPRDSVCDPPIVGCVKPRRLGDRKSVV